MDKTNLELIRESFGRVAYSHKTHEKEAEIQKTFGTITKWVNIVLIALTAGSLLTTLLSGPNLIVVSAILSTITLAFAIFQLSFNPEQKASNHKQAANSLWLIREKHVNLMADIINESAKKQDITQRRDTLTSDLDLIYKSAPATSSWAYKKAREALKFNEELTFSDKEINQLLPKKLQVNKPKK